MGKHQGNYDRFDGSQAQYELTNYDRCGLEMTGQILHHASSDNDVDVRRRITANQQDRIHPNTQDLEDGKG